MPRLTEDPTNEACPDYATAEFDAVQQEIIDAFAGPPPLTNEAAVAQLHATWTALHNQRVAQWNRQEAEDREAAELDREEEERRRIEAERELEDQRKELEKKKPKVNPFDPQRCVGDWIAPRPSAFALNKLQNIEYVELDYFTPRACKQAQHENVKTSTNDTYS